MLIYKESGKPVISVRIVVTESEEVVCELMLAVESKKRLTDRRIARLLAQALPGFSRQIGRLSLSSGMETLPAVEKSGGKWVAWRLRTEGDTASGFEPPAPDSTSEAEAGDNPLSDRSGGVWQRAEISELSEPAAKGRRRSR